MMCGPFEQYVNNLLFYLYYYCELGRSKLFFGQICFTGQHLLLPLMTSTLDLGQHAGIMGIPSSRLPEQALHFSGRTMRV